MLSAKCISCLVNRQFRLISPFDDEIKKAEYMREVLDILRNMGDGETAPVAVERMDARFSDYFGVNRSFEDVKRQYNELLLSKEDELVSVVDLSPDRIATALKLARIGNYIDFGALASVKEEELSELIRKAPEDGIDAETYERFLSDLSGASRLVYIPDNCGEVVFDKILIKVLREEYPLLDITALVRGRPVLNDVTEADAKQVGLDGYCRIPGNGSGIAGTYFPSVSDEAKELLTGADLIVAKGQGNFESLYPSDKPNLFYLLMAKCPAIAAIFNVKPMTLICKRASE